MSVNVELLDRTLAQIEAHPETWNQKEWRCRSGMCFAGWAAELSGGQWGSSSRFDIFMVATPDDLPQHVVTVDSDTYVTAGGRAERVLGLDEDQADRLFDANNTLDDLRRIVAELKASGS